MQKRVEENALYRQLGSPNARTSDELMEQIRSQGGSRKDAGAMEVQTSESGQRFIPKRMANGREARPIHAQADRLRGLFATGAHMRQSREEVNPIWHNFPTRCVQPITTVEEMQQLLKHHSQSDKVMVVRYWQDGCTACNALDKVFEWVCHEQSKKVTNLSFYDVQKEAVPKLSEGMVRFPQVKAFSAGLWADMDFKPPQDFREMIYGRVEKEVHAAAKRGQPISAIAAEEMYFSVAGPAVAQVLEESIMSFYNQAQVRLHNYWKQVSVRRSWYFKKYIEPMGMTEEAFAASLGQDKFEYAAFGEATSPTMTTPSAAPHNVPNAAPSSLGAGIQF